MTTTLDSPEHVHRPLHLVSPIQRGHDIRALQGRLSIELTHREFAWRAPHIDGQAGKQTFHAAAFDAFTIGLPGEVIEEIKIGRKIRGQRRHAPVLTPDTQHLLRNPGDRDSRDHRREKRRKPQLQRLRVAHNTGPSRAVEWALGQVGTHESPPSSNLGPGITKWEQDTGYAVPPGVYWCGCFAHEAIVEVGGAQILESHFFGYGPSIIAYAQAASHGLHAVPFSEARLGDVLVYWGGEHIGICGGAPSGLIIPTIEGNTSAANGSQSNGGEVAAKTRSSEDVSVVARVDHWGR